MVGKLTTLVLLVGGMFGQVNAQQGNTVFATVVTGRTTSGTFVIPAQYMIGQSGHQVIGILSDITAGSCVTFPVALTVQIQGSYDNVNWSNVSPLVLTYPPDPGVSSGQGLYPYIRITATNANPSACKYTLYYGGVVSTVTTAPTTVGYYTFANLNALSNFSQLTEKGPRYVTASTLSAPGAAATVTIGPGGTTGVEVVIDCIYTSVFVSTTIVTGASDTVSDNIGTVFSTSVPTGAVVGTMVTRDMCGLNVLTGLNNGVVFFGSGIPNAREQITVSYFLVGK